MIQIFIKIENNFLSILNSPIIPKNFQLNILVQLLDSLPFSSLHTKYGFDYNNVLDVSINNNNMHIMNSDVLFENLNNAYGDYSELIISKENYIQIIQQWKHVCNHKFNYFTLQKYTDGKINLVGKNELSQEELNCIEQENKELNDHEKEQEYNIKNYKITYKNIIPDLSNQLIKRSLTLTYSDEYENYIPQKNPMSINNVQLGILSDALYLNLINYEDKFANTRRSNTTISYNNSIINFSYESYSDIYGVPRKLKMPLPDFSFSMTQKNCDYLIYKYKNTTQKDPAYIILYEYNSGWFDLSSKEELSVEDINNK